ncbi:MAG: hypothetical protein Fur0022_46010 [Anaerolineales bacterium]
MNTRTKLLLAAILFLIPFVARWAWFNRPQGDYTPPEIPPLDQLTITLPETTFQPVTDTPTPGNGRVVADLTHLNNLETDDLTPLSERLATRGVDLIQLTDYTLLESTLRGATAFVVAAPTYPFDSTERTLIENFVQDGGKLLIIADPTRQIPIPEEELLFNPFAVFFAESAVPIVNSLSSAFGLIYFDDYLYDLTSAEGNYRNVRYSELAANSALTSEVDELVLFAAHSLRGGVPLLTGGENILSNKRPGETALAPAMTSTDGNVVALGDLTLLTAPYHTVADNDQFLSNLADWLAEDGRDWSLTDFPYLFDDTVSYVQLKQADVDPRLLVFGSTLQTSLAEAGIELTVSNVLSPTQDALLAGTFLEHEAVANILHSAGVTITLTFSETAEAPPTLADLQEGKMEITGLGALDLRGTTLYLEYPIGADEVGMIVLAYDDADLPTALGYLISGLPTGCLEQGELIICSTGVLQEDTPPISSDGSADEPGTPSPEEGTQPPADAPSIFIFAMDTGAEGVMTSAYDLEFYLSPYYHVTIWSLAAQGFPTEADVTGTDLVILDSGDYAFDSESFNGLDSLTDLQVPVWLMGAQPIFVSETEPLVDITIPDASHPIVAGITETLITLTDSLSGVPEQLFRPEDFTEIPGTSIILTRGPGNTTPGGPVLFAGDDGTSPRSVIAAFPFYRLPFEVQEILALNIVAWLLGEG